MKKTILSFTIIVFILLLIIGVTSCGSENETETSSSSVKIEVTESITSEIESETSTNPGPSEVFKDEKRMLGLVNSYSVSGTKGFDYLLEQHFGGIVVNSHDMSVRLKNDNEITGSCTENFKYLNEDPFQSQYNEICKTTYYKNGKIAVCENDMWTWQDCQFNEFVQVNINAFVFDFSFLDDLQMSKKNDSLQLTFKIKDEYGATFLGLEEDIKGIMVEIKTTKDFDKLLSFTISYSQKMTDVKINFLPYYGDVSINLP